MADPATAAAAAHDDDPREILPDPRDLLEESTVRTETGNTSMYGELPFSDDDEGSVSFGPNDRTLTITPRLVIELSPSSSYMSLLKGRHLRRTVLHEMVSEHFSHPYGVI